MRYSAVKDDIADPHLYRTYWSLMLGDILVKLGEECDCIFPPTKGNKEILHNFHKRILGYETIAGRSQEVVSRFIFEVCVFWATEYGFFIRTSGNQPENIADLPLSEIIHLL